MSRNLAGGVLLLGVLLLGAGCTPASDSPPAPTSPTASPPATAPAHTVSATGALSGVTPSGPGGVAVVPFAESQAAAVHPGQHVRVTFPAVPGLTLPASVLAVAPDGVQISGVTSYYVTIVLAGTDPRLRAGMTADAEVDVSGS